MLFVNYIFAKKAFLFSLEKYIIQTRDILQATATAY